MFSLGLINIEIDDEAAGEFILLSQNLESGPEGKLGIDPEQWPVLRAAIDRMIEECRNEDIV